MKLLELDKKVVDFLSTEKTWQEIVNNFAKDYPPTAIAICLRDLEKHELLEVHVKYQVRSVLISDDLHELDAQLISFLETEKTWQEITSHFDNYSVSTISLRLRELELKKQLVTTINYQQKVLCTQI